MLKFYIPIVFTYLVIVNSFEADYDTYRTNNEDNLKKQYETVSSIEIESINSTSLYIKDFLGYRYKESYHTTWTYIIYKLSKKYNLNPKLVLSIIKHESSFNAKAESKFGAKGAMQVMWAVWRDKLIENSICKKESDLHILYNGIDAGCFVIDYYIDKYGSTEIALRRYFGISDYAYTYSKNITSEM